MVPLDAAFAAAADAVDAVDALDLDRALTKLEVLDPQQAQVVELRFFGGLTIEETAAAMAISPATVKREWAVAKGWLLRELSGGPRRREPPPGSLSRNIRGGRDHDRCGVTRDEWTRLKAVVSEALVRAPAERLAYLVAECGSDRPLQQEAESLLDAVVRAADLYERDALRVTGIGEGFDLLHDIVPASMRLPADGHGSAGAHEFLGTPRYGVRRVIGVGGMGVVHEVEDRTRRQVVALKTLRRWSPGEIYRLKREFRGLADIAHPNLVPLYDLEVDDEHCFFTMALIDGRAFTDVARDAAAPGTVADRVRRWLPQLVAGVQELHRCHTLHGDLKPSNVLVTPDERVIILDFGLASRRGAGPSTERGVAGIRRTWRPNSAAGRRRVRPATGTAVGATIYHALTGRAPFEGPLTEVLRQKATADPPAPRLVAPGLPADLDALCMGLLHRDPELRLRGRLVLDCLDDVNRVTTAAEPSPARRAVFVGRDAYLDLLHSAWRRVTSGAHAAAYVHGPSGIGKSALLHHFVEDTATDRRVVVFQSRCHEQESMPYKGLDGVVDGLSRYLHALSPVEAGRLLPEDAWALARLFPVMQGLPAPPDPGSEAATADPVALRQRAFIALRETLARVARDQPVIVAIDDFHWADAESGTALAALFQPPTPPALLLLVAFRSEEIDARPFLRAMLERLDHRTSLTLSIAPLSEREAVRLVERLVPGSASPALGARLAIAREAAGHPLLIEELARGVVTETDVRRGVSLDDLLRRRLDRLPDEGRAFLEAVAVCGRPIAAARVFEACGMAGDERPLVARLRAAHFLRSSQAPGLVEMYHDRVRETLAAAIPANGARGIHARLAALMVAHADDDPEALFEHYRGSGQLVAAAGQAAVAAAKAAAVLAFDRAAALYRQALDLDPDAAPWADWAAGLAGALENGGRPVDAAEAYLDATRRARGARSDRMAAQGRRAAPGWWPDRRRARRQ